MKPISMKPISQDIFNNLSEEQKSVNQKMNIINQRVDYIVREIAKVIGGCLDWYDYDNRGDDSDGFFDVLFYRNAIGIIVSWRKYSPDDGIILGGEEWAITSGFPTRWLWENFESELHEGRRLYRDREKQKEYEREQKSLERKRTKKKLKESILKKLTPEERQLVKI